jgi:hypothetical protein
MDDANSQFSGPESENEGEQNDLIDTLTQFLEINESGEAFEELLAESDEFLEFLEEIGENSLKILEEMMEDDDFVFTLFSLLLLLQESKQKQVRYISPQPQDRSDGLEKNFTK